MTTLLFSHASFGLHETPSGHPECAPRYNAVTAALESEDFSALQRRDAPLADDALIESVHPARHLSRLEEAAPQSGIIALDSDTLMGPHSMDAALRAAGAGAAAVDALYAGDARNAFVAARPPGHHAEPERAMGFCFFNTAAVAARRARTHGATRIAVVDFDVHHGNGTEAAFWHDEHAFFASSHEWPQYPGTGRDTDRGATLNIVNAPLATGSDGEVFRRVWGERILPALSDFGPEIIVISAGFDAHAADPLGGLLLSVADFEWATREILAVAADKCGGRVVSVLEGGYDLAALGACVAGHVRVLIDS